MPSRTDGITLPGDLRGGFLNDPAPPTDIEGAVHWPIASRGSRQ